MRILGFELAAGPLRPALVAALIAAPGFLAGCASTSGSSSSLGSADVATADAGTASADATPPPAASSGPTAADKFFGSSASPSGGSNPGKVDYPVDYFMKQGYCPPVQIRAGTEALQTYDRGHDGDAASLKTQSSITKVARECHWSGGTLTMKIGVAGRVIGGPKAAAGTMTLPIRVAVVRPQPTPTTLYTQLYKVTASLTAPDFNVDYTQVIDQVTFQAPPDQRDYLVYIGFDQGKPKAK